MKQDLVKTQEEESENKIPLAKIKQEPVSHEDLVPGFAVDQSLLLPGLPGLDNSVLTSDVKLETKPRKRKKKSQGTDPEGKQSLKPKKKVSLKSKGDNQGGSFKGMFINMDTCLLSFLKFVIK